MRDDFRDALTNDLMSMIEDAILSGGLDHIVLERAAMLLPCGAGRPKARTRRHYDPRSWN